MSMTDRDIYRESKAHMIHRCLRYRLKSEVPSIEFVRRLDMRGATMLDIGANRGVFSIYMSRAAGPSGQVFAFEAQSELGPHLERVKRQFALGNLEVVIQGLSAESGVMTMRRDKVGSGEATLEAQAIRATTNEEFDVPVTTIDAFVAERPGTQIRFIKCDVEGHELKVFLGGRDVLSRDLPVLLFEGHDSELVDGELEEFLTGIGYDGFFFFVEPADHASFWRKGRGRYVPFAERHDLPHCRPGVEHRNYIFVRRATSPSDYVQP